jgi:hypothetical protein
MADNVAPSPWFRGLATWGLALLLTANLALLLIVLAQVWQDFWKLAVLIVNGAQPQTVFDICEDRVDNLQAGAAVPPSAEALSSACPPPSNTQTTRFGISYDRSLGARRSRLESTAGSQKVATHRFAL